MSFSGKYEVESEENYDNFMKRIGLPADVIEKGRTFKIVTEVAQNGDEFTWSQIYPGGKSITNTFVIGKEGDMETLGGKKFKLLSLQAEGCNSIHIYLGLSLIEFSEAYFQATLKMEGGKVVGDFPNYHYTAEIAGDKLVEISTVGDITFKRTSKRVA